MLVIHTTASNKKEAKKLANILIESHLVPCVQYFKIKSQYVWRKRVHKQSEYLLIFKALKEHYEEIRQLIYANHSYEVPEIVSFEAKAAPTYKQWLVDNTKG